MGDKKAGAFAPAFFYWLASGYLSDDQGLVVPVRNYLVAHGGSAERAGVIVFLPVDQNKQQPLADWNRLLAVRTEQLCRVEISELLTFHVFTLRPVSGGRFQARRRPRCHSVPGNHRAVRVTPQSPPSGRWGCRIA